ncbi:MAG: hypothetical protein AAGB35_07485 [Pseudomonadota bacterium]
MIIKHLRILAMSCMLMLAPILAVAAPVNLELAGDVQSVNNPLFGGGTTQGITTSDDLIVTLTYDDAFGASIGNLTGFEITTLSITVPDSTQGGFVLVPDNLNSQTLIIFDQNDSFVGLQLPQNITGFDDITAFSLSGLAFESEGTNGPTFRFNQTNSVVQGIFTTAITPSNPSSVQVPLPFFATVLLGMLLTIIGLRLSRHKIT